MTSILARPSLILSGALALALFVAASAQAQTAGTTSGTTVGATVGAPAGTVAAPVQGYANAQTGLPPVFQPGLDGTAAPQGYVQADVTPVTAPAVATPTVEAPAPCKPSQAATAVPGTSTVEVVDPCASYKLYPDYYATCQDRMAKLKRMQDAKLKRVQDAQSQADAVKARFDAKNAPPATKTAVPNRQLGQPKGTTPVGTVPASVSPVQSTTPVTTTPTGQ